MTVLAFVFIFTPFNQAAAAYGTNFTYGADSNSYGSNNSYYGDSYNNYSNGYYSNNGNSYNNPPYQAPIYTAPATSTPVVYSTTANPAMTVNYTPAPIKTVAKAKTSSTKTAAATASVQPTVSNLAANAIYGSNSFLPSGLIQWIIFAIFILLLVLLSRIIFSGREEYHAAPMKHD